MMPITEYKVLSGTTAQLNEQLPENVMQGWKPILMTATAVGTGQGQSAFIAVMLEHSPEAM